MVRSVKCPNMHARACWAEKLSEDHDLKVSRETLRKWMQDAGIWLSCKQRRTFHQPRLRRECFGELIQIDGSDHRWFEDRGPDPSDNASYRAGQAHLGFGAAPAQSGFRCR